VPRVLIVDDHGWHPTGSAGDLAFVPEWELCGEADNGQESGGGWPSHCDRRSSSWMFRMPVLNGFGSDAHHSRRAPETKVLLLTLHSSTELVSQRVSRRCPGLRTEIGCGAGAGASAECGVRRRDLRQSRNRRERRSQGGGREIPATAGAGKLGHLHGEIVNETSRVFP